MDPQEKMASTDTNTSPWPEDAWLRGYFGVCHCDVRGADQNFKSLRKNIDFLRLRDVPLHLLDPRPGKLILDVGCSEGATMVYCGLQGAEVYGQDLNCGSIEVARRLLHRYALKGDVKCGDARELAFPDNMFDGVIASDFFEHIEYADKVLILREMKRVLKPGAVAVIKTPNLRYLRLSLLYKRLRAIVRLENPAKYVIAHTAGTEFPDHIGLTTRTELARAFAEAQFLNYEFVYAPLRRWGVSRAVEVMSTEIPVLRDRLSEDLICRAWKPIALSHFPD